MNPVGDLAALVLAWSDEINASRALTDAEVDVVCQALWIDERQLINRPWTREDDEKLADMMARGLLAPHVAVELGRSAQAVRSRIKRLKRALPQFLPAGRLNQYRSLNDGL